MRSIRRNRWACRGAAAMLVLLTSGVLRGADRPQWGEPGGRNQVSAEVGLPDRFDPETGLNVKWVVPLGTETWSTPVVSQGRILIGTNNGVPKDPRVKGDRGVLLCLREGDGGFCWQLVAAKVTESIYKDWPRVGMVSAATVEGDRVYMVSNRNEVMCLDLQGQADGNDGSYRDEGRHMVPAGSEPLEVADQDADILWLYDIPAELGIWAHDSAHCSVLVHGDLLYINTSSGLNGEHNRVRVPDKPSLIVLDKHTGRLVAQENEGIGPRIFHSTWSSPALGTVENEPVVFFCGGDGVCYAFDPPRPLDAPVDLHCRWRFDCDPEAPKENVHQYIRNRQVSPSNIKSMPVFHEGRVYITAGGDIWWGKKEANLLCVDARGQGDVTRSGRLWSYAMGEHCCTTPSVWEGLAFVGDCGGVVHCVDAATGRACWTHETDGEIWASTLVADGKVYVATRRGGLWVFAADKEKRLLHQVRLDSPIAGTPVAANGVLYVATMRKLYAFQSGASVPPAQ